MIPQLHPSCLTPIKEEISLLPCFPSINIISHLISSSSTSSLFYPTCASFPLSQSFNVSDLELDHL